MQHGEAKGTTLEHVLLAALRFYGTFGLFLAWVLVHWYFFHRNLFCIPSPIVLLAGPGYTQSFK